MHTHVCAFPVDYLTALTTYLAQLLWPARCAGCNQLGAFACQPCLQSLALAQRRPLRHHEHLDQLIAATPLTKTAEAFVYALKYRGVQSLAIPVADRLCDLLCLRPDTTALFGPNPLIVPVPLHKSRQNERGFNQAELLARRIASTTIMQLDTTTLIRVRATGQQAKQASRDQRRENVRGAFAVSGSASMLDRDIVLIDDVCTTGATLDDCARALKSAGANSVSAIVFAHG